MTSSYYQDCAIPKPEPRKRTKARKKRHARMDTAAIRQYVFARERNLCRCCRKRPADSLHEIRPRSLRGKVSKTNSVALCGSGTTGCHGFCQQHQILVQPWTPAGAEGELAFLPMTDTAADWMQIRLGAVLTSPPMRETEIAL